MKIYYLHGGARKREMKHEKIADIINKISGYEADLALEADFVKGDAFKILISTVLSHRTRDEKTIEASKKLFSKFKSVEQLADASIEEIEELIKDVGFYRVKAKRIKELARIIKEEYSGKVPNKMEELLKLPGVGRKTANCVLLYAYAKPAIPVDTHVHRIFNRIGIVKTSSPEETEKELRKIIPEKFWKIINESFIKFGKNVCKPIKPRCEICRIKDYCEYYKNRNFY